MNHFATSLPPRVVFRWLICLVVCSACSFHCIGGRVAAEEAKITDLQIGIAQTYRIGYWAQVRTTITAGNQACTVTVETTAPDGEGVETVYRSENQNPLQLAAGQRVVHTSYVKIGRRDGRVQVALKDENQQTIDIRSAILSEKNGAVSSSQPLILTIGHPVGLQQILKTGQSSRNTQQQRTFLIETLNPAELPDHWSGYQGFDAIVVTTSQPEFLNDWTTDQRDALLAWVRLGGRLVICVGANGAALLGENGILAPFAPGRFVEVVELTQTSRLETFVSATEQLAKPQTPVKVTRLENVRGIIDAFEGNSKEDLPIVIRSAVGFGQVVFVTADIDQAPFPEWQARGTLLSQLFKTTLPTEVTQGRKRGRGRVSHIGYDDMAGQLRGALDRFSSVHIVQFTWVAILIVLFILCIGPGDYFLLRKWIGKMEWTWLTFTLIVVAFCLVAFVGVYLSKGRQLYVNRVEIIDIDATSSVVRGTMVSHLYSPHASEVNLSYRPSYQLPGPTEDALLAWEGLPGKGLGGMESRISGMLFENSYAVNQNWQARQVTTDMAQVPIQVASSKAINAQWWSQTDLQVSSRLSVERQGSALVGEITNPLPVTLTDCVIAFGTWAYLVNGDFEPQERIQISTHTTERNLHGYVTRRRAVDGRDMTNPWDPTGVDVPRIIEVMMLYEAAGGKRYTQLAHQLHGRLDLSYQLSLGQAILMGRSETHSDSLRNSDEPLASQYDRQWTFYRILLPVQSSSNPPN